MKEGQASKTAEYVCMGRALADGRIATGRFHDPTAIQLLPEASRREVERRRNGDEPATLKQRLLEQYWQTQSAMMVARTVRIDDEIRAAALPQLVVLGAGLDGRAWRMPELCDVSVFEVDHPDSQRDKRERAAELTPASRDLRFVPVDFQRDELDQALSAAGHDPLRPTTWVWEGVVMYLALSDIRATLDVIRRRSVPGSRLIICYHAPALILKVVGLLLRRVGEPLRSAFRPEELARLCAEYGFQVESDLDMPTIAESLMPELGPVASRVRHLRVASARKI